MQREAWQSMPIGYESESNWIVVASVMAPDNAVRVDMVVEVISLKIANFKHYQIAQKQRPTTQTEHKNLEAKLLKYFFNATILHNIIV